MAKKKNATRFPREYPRWSRSKHNTLASGCWSKRPWNKSGQPLAGRVIAHSQEKETVVATGVQYRKQHRDVQLFLFYAGEKIPEGVVVLL